eukprot:SAG31_NODE_14003_length_832_cov_2.450205_1_plen_56_part_10
MNSSETHVHDRTCIAIPKVNCAAGHLAGNLVSKTELRLYLQVFETKFKLYPKSYIR